MAEIHYKMIVSCDRVHVQKSFCKSLLEPFCKHCFKYTLHSTGDVCEFISDPHYVIMLTTSYMARLIWSESK